jgi:hypothetical protein
VRALVCLGAFFLTVCYTVFGEDAEIAARGGSKPIAYNFSNEEAKPFPGVYYADAVKNIMIKDAQAPFGAATKEEAAAALEGAGEKEKPVDERLYSANALLLENDVLAFYGQPSSKNMGILGRHSKEELLERLNTFAADYEAVSGGRSIVKAFHIIYGTCWPEGEIGIINKKVLQEYIDFALENNMIVFLDHQIGKYDPVKSLEAMLPYLKHPNVHLALDPEWRTTKPMVEIGSVNAEELNAAQQVMQDYIIKNKIPGERMLMVHQFNYVMIKNRSRVKTELEKVRLLLCMDGHGSPEKKRGTYAFNAEATNIPLKAFKLFLNEKGNTGVDSPLLTPKEVYELNPRPYVIIYQ